eukprot:GEMP01073766.1.p1 GENE.GEMP01073766.1~~GEMP01073766.1.p1  ORF type:complete len:182 (+),score=40.13 GEMP01073766.1:74-619(+)
MFDLLGIEHHSVDFFHDSLHILPSWHSTGTKGTSFTVITDWNRWKTLDHHYHDRCGDVTARKPGKAGGTGKSQCDDSAAEGLDSYDCPKPAIDVSSWITKGVSLIGGILLGFCIVSVGPAAKNAYIKRERRRGYNDVDEREEESADTPSSDVRQGRKETNMRVDKGEEMEKTSEETEKYFV